AQGNAQLHHEHLRGAHGILFLRQQAVGSARACREVKATGIVLKLSQTRVIIMSASHASLSPNKKIV
ncbi:MAG: hypothetical protein K2G12_05820, partial [Prevotella sp.]|nr:hypothetical protein [Prevotella sp.]